MAAPSVSSATSSLASAASDAFSDALDSSSSVASMASDSIASANTDLSSAVSESSSDLLGSSATSASSAASATATKMATDAQGQGMSFLSKFGIFATVLVTILAGLAAAIYFSGYADDIFTYVAKKYYMGKAKAQVTAMGNMGSDKAESFMKDSLKQNPVMGKGELEQVAPGLGNEAAKEGVEGVSDKLGGLGKI